jgi:hypothetical protein
MAKVRLLNVCHNGLLGIVMAEIQVSFFHCSWLENFFRGKGGLSVTPCLDLELVQVKASPLKLSWFKPKPKRSRAQGFWILLFWSQEEEAGTVPA